MMLHKKKESDLFIIMLSDFYFGFFRHEVNYKQYYGIGIKDKIRVEFQFEHWIVNQIKEKEAPCQSICHYLLAIWKEMIPRFIYLLEEKSCFTPESQKQVRVHILLHSNMHKVNIIISGVREISESLVLLHIAFSINH